MTRITSCAAPSGEVEFFGTGRKDRELVERESVLLHLKIKVNDSLEGGRIPRGNGVE